MRQTQAAEHTKSILPSAPALLWLEPRTEVGTISTQVLKGLLEVLRHPTHSKMQWPWRLLLRSLDGGGLAVPLMLEFDLYGSEDFFLLWVICFSLACDVKSNNVCVPQFKIVYTWMITQHDNLLSHTNLMIC